MINLRALRKEADARDDISDLELMQNSTPEQLRDLIAVKKRAATKAK